ncbi:MAG: peptidoglycan DD-metalloendopeptidase family protein [Eubacterium sp.]|nr:peptidoglycan DD-metalloendopeptidase family protein [Eubacterium sp.]
MNIFKKAVAICLVMVMGVSVALSSSFADVKSEKSKLNNLKSQKSEVQNKKAKLKKKQEKAQAAIDELDAQQSEIAGKLYQTNVNLRNTKKDIKTTTRKLKKAKASVNKQYKDMKLRIQYMYENGETEMLDLILNSDSIGDFLNKAEYITELSTYDRNMLGKLKNTKKSIAKSKKKLEKSKVALTSLKKSQEADQARIASLQEKKQAEIDSYDKKMADVDAASSDLEAEIRAQEVNVSNAEKFAAASPSSSSSKRHYSSKKSRHSGGSGTLAWPVPGYTSVSSGYGWRSNPVGSGRQFHASIDIPAPTGTPVIAAASGTVAFSYKSSSAGNFIGIDHSGGIRTRYMHLSKRYVSAGQYVKKGKVIGLVGTTGWSTGPHLDFSVQVGGECVNPWDYL